MGGGGGKRKWLGREKVNVVGERGFYWHSLLHVRMDASFLVLRLSSRQARGPCLRTRLLRSRLFALPSNLACERNLVLRKRFCGHVHLMTLVPVLSIGDILRRA